jgi:hypothetical protein
VGPIFSWGIFFPAGSQRWHGNHVVWMTAYDLSTNKKAMDNSTHSSSSQPPNQAAASSVAAAATAPAGGGNSAPTTTTTTTSPKRAAPNNPQQAQLIKLRDANTKYKNLLKLAKERIQEQEGLLDERRCELNFFGVVLLRIICV